MLDVELFLDVVNFLVDFFKFRHIQGLRALFLFVDDLFSHLLDFLLAEPAPQSTLFINYILI